MTWHVHIFTTRDRRDREWLEVLAINDAPSDDEMPNFQVGLLPDRDRALKLARDFADEYGIELYKAPVIPFPQQGRAA